MIVRASQPGLSANNTSPSTSDRSAFSAGEHDELHVEASDVLNDLGCVIKPSMRCEEVSRAVSELSAGQKYKLLTDHYKPNADFPFPCVFHCGCNRSFQYKWLEKYEWLVYSKALDGGFCRFCALFARHRSKLNVLVNKPFVTWVKVHKVVGSHASNQYHIHAVEEALEFKRSIEQPEVNVDVRMNAEPLHCIQENRHIVSVVQRVFSTVADNALPLGEMLKS